jgi:hypothetical protein
MSSDSYYLLKNLAFFVEILTNFQIAVVKLPQENFKNFTEY